MLSRVALRLVRTSPVRASPIFAVYAARPRTFTWTRTLANTEPPRNPNDVPEPNSSKKPSDVGEEASESSQADANAAESETKPNFPLPDLTQGIPSTFEFEAAQAAAAGRSSLTAAHGGEGGKRELPDSAYVSSSDRKRQSFAKWSFISALAGMVGAVAYLGRNWEDADEERRHPDAPNGWNPAAWWKRASARSNTMVTYFSEPAFETLLPKLDPMLEKPYTLCISLEDMLVHSEWSREHGWRVAKRPGVDYFLRYLSQYYELVLFTSIPSAVALPVIQKLDPFQMIMFPLFREATKYKDGEFVKDLSYLNRDLSKVIILDTSPAHVSAQPENAIILPKWTGDKHNTDLVSLIPFLEYIHTMQYDDVRKVLKSFEGQHIPTEFARREAIARAEFQKRIKDQKTSRSTGVGFFGNMLGLKASNMSMMVSPDGEPNLSEAYAQGKMIQDIARERGQRYVEALEKDIRENGERYLKEQQAMMEQQQQEMMNSMMGSFSTMFVEKKEGEEEPKKA